MNNINPGNIPPVTPAKLEAANSKTVNTGSGEVHQNVNSRTLTSSQAALVTLDKFITTELDKLGQTIVSRSAIVDNLPPQVKELVQHILKQTQSVQTALPQGLATVLKSPQTAAEKLLFVAAELEEAAGVPKGQPAKADTSPPEQPQSAANSTSAWKNFNPEILKAAAMTPSASQNPSQPQDLANLIKTALAQPELIKNLPPEIRKLLQNLVLQEEPALPGPPMSQPSPEAPPPLVRQPQTAPEKLLHLASALEQAAEPAIAEGRQAAKANAALQPDLAEAVRALRGKSPEELKTSAGMIRELAETMPRAGGILTERQDNQRVLSFTTLLYFDAGETAYPAHIHLFHQKEEDQKHPGHTVAETWLRVCLETENLGLVDTLFRLHDRDMVDVKVQFGDQSAAAAFAAGADEVKDKLRELPLTLGEFLVK